MWGITSVIGLDVPIIIFSSITLLWSIALLIIDDRRQRYAIRHILVGLTSSLILIGAVFDLNADAVNEWAATSRVGFVMPIVCFLIARSLAWCIYFDTLRTTAIPNSIRSQPTFFLFIVAAYVWTAVTILASILWTATFSTYGQAGKVDLEAAFGTGTFGLSVFLALSILLQREIFLKPRQRFNLERPLVHLH
ncbi:hypothetical protein O0I10_007429 [Lichtheimia ornata]|uniref:Uncharacterized protein n=1 Tax=Lichtheimia ornata TaxID=688661 RepID=A0AAD7V0E2_9FUNG|nr:uncharacterized protein O0I10_007429 [Lichtheimia ornata]KAJ8656832.1 hypothetical protein O0I10_007429 [Lichtheimia ornata]